MMLACDRPAMLISTRQRGNRSTRMARLLSLCLVVCLVGANVARADGMQGDEAPRGVNLTAPTPDPDSAPPNRKLRRTVGIGLVIGAAALTVLGFAFVGAAAKANSDVLAGNAYHPHKEDRRDNFEIADAVMFSAAAVAFVPGMVLIWDR